MGHTPLEYIPGSKAANSVLAKKGPGSSVAPGSNHDGSGPFYLPCWAMHSLPVQTV